MMKSYKHSSRRDTAGSSLQVDTLTLAKSQASNEAPINWGISWNWFDDVSLLNLMAKEQVRREQNRNFGLQMMS